MSWDSSTSSVEEFYELSWGSSMSWVERVLQVELREFCKLSWESSTSSVEEFYELSWGSSMSWVERVLQVLLRSSISWVEGVPCVIEWNYSIIINNKKRK